MPLWPRRSKSWTSTGIIRNILYFIDGQGNVCHKPKSGVGESKILVEHAVDRDNQFLYFIDKEGDISRSPRGQKKKAA